MEILTRPRVLVVDDDPDIADVLVAALADAGYAVATGIDGEALEIAFSEPPDLVLLDFQMPVMDGVEVCRRLRQDPRTHDIPVVFFTATPESLVRRRLGDCRYDGLITKPCDLGELLDTVATFCPVWSA